MKVSTTFDFRPWILDFENYYVLHYVLHFSIYYVLHPSDYVLHLFIDYVLHTYSHYVLQVEYVMEYVKKKTTSTDNPPYFSRKVAEGGIFVGKTRS